MTTFFSLPEKKGRREGDQEEKEDQEEEHEKENHGKEPNTAQLMHQRTLQRKVPL